MNEKNTSIFTPVLIGGSLILLISFAIRSTFGLFQIPIAEEFLWARSEFSMAIAIQNLAWGIGTPLFSAFAEKFGDRKAITLGLILYAVGVFISSSASSPEAHQFLNILIGFGIAGSGFGPILAVVGRTASPEKRSLAMGLIAAAASFGQFAVVLPTMWMNKTFGWETSLVVLSAISLSLLIVLPLLNNTHKENNKTEEFQSSLQNTLLFSLKERNYILLIMGFFVCGFHVTFIALHLPADLMFKGISAEVAGWSLAIIGVTNIIGTLCFGWLGTKIKKPIPLASIYLMRSLTITIFVLSPPSATVAILFGAVIGILWLATVPMTNAIILAFIGPKYLATLSGICFICHQLGAVLGAWLGGKFFDIYGSYENMWWLSVALGIVAFLLTITVKEEPFSVNSELKQTT